MILILCSVLQSFVTMVLGRPLTAHMIHLIIPAIKKHVPVSNVISAVMVASKDNTIKFPLDVLYCLLSVVQERIGECSVYTCVHHMFVFVYVCAIVSQTL